MTNNESDINLYLNFFLDIKVVLDFVPNHSSNESVWFEEALRGHEKYYDYFIWEDGVVDENGELRPPNNWVLKASLYKNILICFIMCI